MNDLAQRVVEAARSFEAMEESDRAALVADLERLTPEQVRPAMLEAAREAGVVAVPLLEEVARRAPVSVAVLAVGSLGAIRHAEAAAALQRLATGSGSGEVRKAARRELHRLATLRIVPPAAGAPRREARAPMAAVHRSLASPIDGAGNRALWFAFRAGSDIDLLTMLLHEEAGIVDAAATDMARSRFDREAGRVLQDEDFPWIDLPADYCRHLVQEAHARNATSGTSLPVEYLAWRDRIGPPQQAYEQPLVYTVINAAEVRWDPRYLDNSSELLGLELFRAWVIDREEMEEFVRERVMAEESGLLLAGMAQRARDRMVVDRAIQKLFDVRRRALFKRRLEEMAYLLWKRDRTYQARMAMASAMALEPPDRSLLHHPFVRSLVEWSLEVVESLVRGERARPVRPGVQIHLPY